ncbi:bifunctional glycosyltransferase family 2 protein/CDP-glycerol:glycerophosphate glycerophosphotransferase [Kitasatospora sp. YST-16]|uniref:bifunctional glycosyltransferase/CDP-glycerol:glycerophosphate glycerophosphotransferase n=1 Tax=Kitasatospora sp. YST-16 TaxID=2998080 RepID=UPI002284362E|nr:bifunctional glycosyltransferase family 2 protein/CDP-glycerol:glycerophosphate glycerophosphotransferase [Kitasatospora sp. YST-16]WAL71173.1 bifunctional glycosyltransferase family 2 protein/CDP-glycerol:glycerophosphate glycerophosphotransferase [Kitasatospora sp. YST-16]WNW37210.1 bifunctional glycosyltransferase family 2 protein/CDP-glycerol:glycerophosphate glycerophosphotransferase [Streptomyces sp. Li-HN-5-13]
MDAYHPRLSVVVPFQDVEAYLAECLESIARQSFRDFEVILVDDGSTDGSTGIARAMCARDPRFRLIRQDAHGPGHARNTGLRAMHPDGEFLVFADGDDVVPEQAYETLLRTLEESGSDFVSGNVQMMTSTKKWQSPLHKAPMAANRRGTHITKYDKLIYDRTVWNKLFRRSFWDYYFIEFPEGVLYEDSWVNMFAHFRAAKVDTITDVVYYWRRREGNAAPSITQRHHEIDNLRDRVNAVLTVSRFLGRHRSRTFAESKRKYDLACLASDLMLHLKALPDGDEEYRTSFITWANEFLDEAGEDLIEELPAEARVKWLLVRHRKLQALLDVVEFERRGGPLPIQRRFHRYLKYPHLGDRGTGIGRKAYRLGKELSLHGSIGGVRWDGDRLEFSGNAYIRFLNVHKRHMSIKALALRNKKQGRMLLVPARTVYAPQATEHSNQNRYCYDWSGFSASFDTNRLKQKGQWVEGTWDVAAGVLSRGLFRYRGLDRGSAGSAANPPYRYVDKNTRVLPLFVQNRLKLRVEVVRCRITGHRLVGDRLELRGVHLGPTVPTSGQLRLVSLGGAGRAQAPVHFTAGGEGWCTFTVRVPLRSLVPSHRGTGGDGEGGVPESWDLGANGWKTTFHVAGRKMTMYPVMAEDTPDGHHRLPAELQTPEGDRELVVHRNGAGYLVLFERAALPLATRFGWEEDGTLEVVGRYPALQLLPVAERRQLHLVLRSRAQGIERAVPVELAGEHFRARFVPSRIRTLAGTVPLAAGRWDLFLRRQDPSRTAPADLLPDLMLKLDQEAIPRLPQSAAADGRDYELQAEAYDRLSLLVHSAMPDHARGPYRQKLLRTKAYPAARQQAVRPTVLFDAFKGTQYSDSPRAVHEELVRRGVALEHLWVVKDDQVDVPDTARAVRMWSPEWYEALATSRYVVANNHLPDWFRKRPGQVVVQTWHGTPLKKIGHDIEAVHFADKRYLERLAVEVENWDLLVSPNSFSTPILRRAFGFPGEMVESGYPRNDVLRRPGTERLATGIRRRIGIPDGKRVVLYAPTWRDDQYYAPGRYKFDFRIDLDDARARLGEDHVLLVRRHPNVVDPVPGAGDGFVFDVSDYPDMADLSLITDVMITDYSSLMFDYVNTGRPILFFTYDLEHYRDTLRGFYFDFQSSAPGPLVFDSQELISSIRDVDRIEERYAERYRRFQDAFCDLDDGYASVRLADRILVAGGDLEAPPQDLSALPLGDPGPGSRSFRDLDGVATTAEEPPRDLQAELRRRLESAHG